MPIFNHFGVGNNQEVLDLLIQIVKNGNKQVDLLQFLKTKAPESFNFGKLSEILSNSLPSLSLQEKEGNYDSPVVLNIGSEPVKIVEKNSHNLISLSNIGQHECWLKFGEPPIDSSDFHLPIPPGFNALKFETNSQDIYLFSTSDNEITQIVYSNFIESNNTEEATKIMQIKPLFGTGENWRMDGPEWQWWIPDLNSTATGYKLFSFESFNPFSSYNFTVSPGTIAYKSTIDFPINIYLFDLTAYLLGGLYFIQSSSPSLAFCRETVSIAKRNSWAAKLPATGGTFQLTPSHGKFIGLIDLQVESEQWAQTAVFNFQETDNTFLIEGF